VYDIHDVLFIWYDILVPLRVFRFCVVFIRDGGGTHGHVLMNDDITKQKLIVLNSMRLTQSRFVVS